MRMHKEIVPGAEKRPKDGKQRANQPLNITPAVAVVPKTDLCSFEQH